MAESTPITVIVTGDRDSTTSYRPIITMVLKKLPKGSTVIHGGCRGIDTVAGEIASELGLTVEAFPISKGDWSKYGRAAGPRRNHLMLKELTDTTRDHVLAFHPDISYSKGTRHMMEIAYQAGFRVYLFDLKDKVEFEGDFDGL